MQGLLRGGTFREPFLSRELRLDVHVFEGAFGDGLEGRAGCGTAVAAADRGIVAGDEQDELRILGGDEPDGRSSGWSMRR